MNKFLVLAILLMGCGTESEEFECPYTREDQTGEYTVVLKETSGDCGPIGEITTDITNGVIYPSENLGCNHPPMSVWYLNSCTNISRFECDDGEWETIMTWELQSDLSNPSRITGTLRTDMIRWGGLYTCSSEYSLEAINESR